MIAAAYWRFRGSLAPGFVVAFALLGLIVVLLWQLVLVSENGSGPFLQLNGRDWQILKFTTFQAALSTVISIAIGLSLAWSLSHQSRFPGRSLFVALLSSALVLPTLVVVLGLVTVLGRKGWLNDVALQISGQSLGGFLYGLTGILIAHAYLNGSFAVRSLLGRLEQIPVEKRKLARSLGLSAWHRFLFLEWPAIRSTLPGISATIFLLCFTSFAIVLTLGGSPRFNTLEVAIYEAVKLDFDLPRALDLALLQLVICAALVLMASGLRSTIATIGARGTRSVWPEPLAARALQIAIIFILGASFLLPLAAVVVDGLHADFGRLFAEPTFQKAFATSLSVATASSVLTLALAILLAAAKRNFTIGHRLPPSPVARFLEGLLSFSGTLYLAVPSLVLGLGFFLIARRFSGSLNMWALVALLLANVLMALPFALAILSPAMEKTALRYDRLSFSLGLGGLARWRTAEWPLLRHDIGYVCAVAFCLSLGDLGVIALFGNQDFATLPWYLYQKMGSYRTDDAAGIALVMLVLMMTVFLLLPRVFAGRERMTERPRAET